MMRFRTSLFAAAWVVAGATASAVACGQEAAPAPVANHTLLRVDVTTNAGSPLANALVVVKLYNPLGVLLDSSFGATNQAGSYLLNRADPLEGMYPITVRVEPPPGSGLSPAQVNDSTEYVRQPVAPRIVAVTLRP